MEIADFMSKGVFGWLVGMRKIIPRGVEGMNPLWERVTQGVLKE